VTRFIGVICLCILTLPAFCQSSTNKYQTATIVAVKTHPATANATADVTSYDVSMQVDDTVYVVVYTPPFGMTTVQHAAGRQLLVLVGKNTITVNDILGNPSEVPIVSRTSAPRPGPSK
jgi:hypothetical protein